MVFMYAVYTCGFDDDKGYPRHAMKKTSRAERDRDRYHHGDLRQALVDSALRIVSCEGPTEVSLRALARQLGVSPRAPYRHFANKEALLAAVATEAIQRYQAHLDSVLEEAASDPLARFHARGVAYVSFAVAQPALFRSMNPTLSSVDESAPELVEARGRLLAAMLEDLVAAQEVGLIRSGEPMGLALTAWALVHGMAVLLIEGQLERYSSRVDPAVLTKLVGDTLYRGLCPDHAGTTAPRSRVASLRAKCQPPESVLVRRAGAGDLEVLVAHHRLMFEELVSRKEMRVKRTDWQAMDAAYREKLQGGLPSGRCLGIIVEQDGRTVASGCASIAELVPLPDDSSSGVGYVHSVYTETVSRRRGLATRVVESLLAACREAGVGRFELTATESGTKLYRALGFRDTTVMRMNTV